MFRGTPRLVHAFEGYLPEYRNKEQAQVPLALQRLVPGLVWAAYLTRPHPFDDPADMPVQGIGAPLTAKDHANDPGLYNLSDRKFYVLAGERAGRLGNLLFVFGNRILGGPWQLLGLLLFRAGCRSRGERGFVYVKMDWSQRNLDLWQQTEQGQHPLKRLIRRWVLRQMARQVDVWSLEDAALIPGFCRAFPMIAPDRVVAVMNAPATGFVAAAAAVQGERKPVFLLVGRLGHPLKRHDMAVDAFAQIAAHVPDWQLQLVGNPNPEFERWLQENHNGLLASRRIVLSGFISEPAQLANLYGQCGVYLQPSKSEGASLALIEAAFCGAPIIATPVGNAVQVLGEDAPHWTVPVDGVQQLADRMLALATDSAGRHAYSQRLQQRIRAVYTWDRQLASLADRIRQATS